MKYSQRHKYTEVKSVAQRESLDAETRNGLWSAVTVYCFQEAESRFLKDTVISRQVVTRLWLDYFKRAIDTIPDWGPEAVSQSRSYFYKCEWYEALDFVEFVVPLHPRADQLRSAINAVLEREMSAYRLVGESVVEITSPTEIEEIETAANSGSTGVRIHIQQAISLLSDRTEPDFRNSIKESISAVEAVVNELASTTGLTLGEGLKQLDPTMHGAFRTALGNLYGYTSDGDGIRHSLLEEPDLGYADAKFMLVTCSAFVNYLIARHGV